VGRQKPPGAAEQGDEDCASGCLYSKINKIQNLVSKGMEMDELELSHEFH